MAFDNYDSAFCGSLPLHHTNLVQSHGAMIVVEFETMNIIQANENVEKFLHTSVQHVAGNNLAHFRAPDEVANLPFTLICKTDKGKKDALVLWLHSHHYAKMHHEKAFLGIRRCAGLCTGGKRHHRHTDTPFKKIILICLVRYAR